MAHEYFGNVLFDAIYFVITVVIIIVFGVGGGGGGDSGGGSSNNSNNNNKPLLIHTKVSFTAISKPVIFHIFYNCKPSACRPCRAKDCTVGTVFDLVQINNQIEIQGFGINGSSDFHLEGFLKHLRYQLH